MLGAFSSAVAALALTVAQAVGAGFCPASHDVGVECPTPLRATLKPGCALTPAQRALVNREVARTPAHHRHQLRYAFPRDASGTPALVFYLAKTNVPGAYQVLNADNTVYERCGNLVHTGPPYNL
jgi:hypothetical protein